jgi:signal transduction histidine kinase
LPHRWTILIVVISILPAALIGFGIDLGLSPRSAASMPWPVEIRGPGAVLHTVLEWTAVWVALFAAAFALIHYRIHRDVMTAVLGIALFAAGGVDAFHILASDGFLPAVSDPERFVPFTWAASRIFNSTVILGGAIFLLWVGSHDLAHRPFIVPLTCAISAVAAVSLVYTATVVHDLPRTHVTEGWVARPLDIVPLILYLLAGALVLPLLYRRHPSAFSHALLLSMVPQVATQLHMAFGSTHLFDAHFNAAHVLKVIGYAVPFAGLGLAYVHTHRQALAARQAWAEAEGANRSKAEFMATLSHELRTPLSAILGYTELLERDAREPLTEAAQRKVARIHHSARNLLHLIDEMLALSRIEAGREQLVLESVDLDDLLEEIVAVAEPLASGKQLHFEARRELGAASIVSDPGKLRQILINLLGNAIKFTHSGTVDFSLRSVDGAAEFCVRDTGIGITPAEHARLFEPFWQGRRMHAAGGAGLGLAISLRYATMLGGRIVVDSRPGHGSAFTLIIPDAGEAALSTHHDTRDRVARAHGQGA